MPPRRMKLTVISFTALIIILYYYYTSSDPSDPEHYLRVMQEMQATDRANAAAKAKLQASLAEAAARSRKSANEKAPGPENVPPHGKLTSGEPREGDKGSVNSGEAMAIDAEKAKKEGKVAIERPERIGSKDEAVGGAKAGGGGDKQTKLSAAEEEKKREIEAKEKEGQKPEENSKLHDEIANILNRAPIIIFSKTFCPFSTKAKRLLLRTYRILPAPYVVELDEHPLGTEIQAWLEKFTGRKTVPNIVVNSKSIGGSDELVELEREGKLESTIRAAAGKQVSEFSKLDVDLEHS